MYAIRSYYGAKMYLREGEKTPLVELIKGIAIVSGNDACVAVAEGLFGGEQALVDKMNQKLRDLNLQDSKFQTVDGWPAPEQYTTAYDMAMLARAYIREHPEAVITSYSIHYTKLYEWPVLRPSTKGSCKISSLRLCNTISA